MPRDDGQAKEFGTSWIMLNNIMNARIKLPMTCMVGVPHLRSDKYVRPQHWPLFPPKNEEHKGMDDSSWAQAHAFGLPSTAS